MNVRGNSRTREQCGPVMALLAASAVLAGWAGAPARADEPGKELVVKASSAQSRRVIWQPASARAHLGTRSPGCPPVVASVANCFNSIDQGGEITLQAGMIVGEGFGSTYTIPDPDPATVQNEAFPVEVSLVEFFAGTVASGIGSNITMGYRIEVWDGEPGQPGSSIAFTVDSGDPAASPHLPPNISLQRVAGQACADSSPPSQASVVKVQFSVDPAAAPADRMIVNGTSGTNKVSIMVYMISANLPSSGCNSLSPCNNAFLATEGNSVSPVCSGGTAGNGSAPTFPTRNWLYAASCPFGCSAGYTKFSNLASLCRPTHDVLQQITYQPSVCAPAATGACCSGAGACSVVTQASCTGVSVYQGNSTTCATGTCPTGACCTPAGACSTTTQTGCAGGAVYQGTGTNCSPNPCPQPTGACCAPAGTCSILSASACATGTFAGANTTCNAQSCPGACCIGSGCLSASLGDCGGVGGTYQGNASACAAGACPMGACCIASSGSCSISTPAACASSGGTYGGNAGACNTTFCPLPTGACCASNGFCLTDQTQTACANVGFAWQGGGTVCAPNPCSAPGVCCRGATCAAGVAQASCTPPGAGIGASFVSASGACNSTGANTTPCCYADFNKASGITVQDIFDFLGAWFAGSPYSRLGGDGAAAPVVQDIFNFLNAWFSGC